MLYGDADNAIKGLLFQCIVKRGLRVAVAQLKNSPSPLKCIRRTLAQSALKFFDSRIDFASRFCCEIKGPEDPLCEIKHSDISRYTCERKCAGSTCKCNHLRACLLQLLGGIIRIKCKNLTVESDQRSREELKPLRAVFFFFFFFFECDWLIKPGHLSTPRIDVSYFLP